MKTLEKIWLQQTEKRLETKGKLGSWREKARWHRKKNIEKDFIVGIHQILQTRGKGRVSIHHKSCMNILVVNGCVYFPCFHDS